MKPDFAGYYSWFKEKFDVDLSGKPSSVYEFVIRKLYSDFEKSNLWLEFNRNLESYNDEYNSLNGYPLLKPGPIPIYIKSYESLVNKSFRKNVLLNTNFPEPPLGGWITPDNWFAAVKDLLRTSITARYLDGVEFIANKIEELTQKHEFDFSVDYEAREEGYYAAHITIEGKFTIVNSSWDEVEILLPIEIQITTQLQEVIKGLLHKMYEEIRIAPKDNKNIKWQWDYKSQEFSSNYLGHILHYVEGMILEVRDKQKNK